MPKKSIKLQRMERVKELQQEYKILANRANKRMRALERLAENPEYKAVLGYSYRNATHDLKGLGELTKHNRFSLDITRMAAKDTNINHLTALIVVAQSFLDSPSSTKRHIDIVYGNRAKTLNRKFNTNLTADDMKTFFESAYWEKLSNNLGSQTAMIVIGKIQKNTDKILAQVRESKYRYKNIDLDALKNVGGLDINKQISAEAKKIIFNLAKIYDKK